MKITIKRLFLTLFMFTNIIYAQDSIKKQPDVKLYYFHITNRCNTCYSIEANVHKTVDSLFKSFVNEGKFELHVLNCELPENKALVKKYSAYGATLAITKFNGEKDIRSEDLTTWAFMKVYTPEIFVKELSEKINEFLKN